MSTGHDCKKMLEAVEEDAIREEEEVYRVFKDRTANDGDGRIDAWEGKSFTLNFCPFCGKRLK
jgi:hypothetical protein